MEHRKINLNDLKKGDILRITTNVFFVDADGVDESMFGSALFFENNYEPGITLVAKAGDRFKVYNIRKNGETIETVDLINLDAHDIEKQGWESFDDLTPEDELWKYLKPRL